MSVQAQTGFSLHQSVNCSQCLFEMLKVETVYVQLVWPADMFSSCLFVIGSVGRYDIAICQMISIYDIGICQMISTYDIVICQMVCMGTVLLPLGDFLDNVVFFQKMKASRWSWPVRWETAILIYTGLICNYAMRMNISIAILKVLVFQLICIHFMIHIFR